MEKFFLFLKELFFQYYNYSKIDYMNVIPKENILLKKIKYNKFYGKKI